MSAIEKKIQPEVRPLTGGEVWHGNPEKMSLGDRIEAMAIVKFLKEKLEKRYDVLRDRLLADVQQVGTLTEKGGFKFVHEGSAVRADKRVGKLPEESGLALLLEKAGLSMDDVTDTVIVKQMNPSKINYLIQTGKLKQNEVEALHKTSFALFLDNSEQLSAMLAEASKQFTPPPEKALTEGASASSVSEEKPKSKAKKTKAA